MQYPSAPSRGNCGGQSTGRQVWPAAKTPAGKLSPVLPAVERRQTNWHCGSQSLWDAAFHFPLPRGDLRKRRLFKRKVNLQESVLFGKLTAMKIYFIIIPTAAQINTFTSKKVIMTISNERCCSLCQKVHF